MQTNSKLLAALFAVGILVAPVTAVTAADIEVTIAPPADRVEVVPAPREGYVYERGYWRWDNDAKRYDWTDGRYIKNREGHKYVEREWRQDGDKWRFRAGHWDDE